MFESLEPEFYKLLTTVPRDDDSTNMYTVNVGQCNIQTSVDKTEYEDIHQNALICPGESISEKEQSKISEKKKDNMLIHFSWCTYLIISTRQSEIMYYIIFDIIIELYG